MAGFFAEEFLSEVLARNDIVDVIGGYVQLKRKGSSWWGLCPFHGEKTPSFHVVQDKQIYHCFGCHAGGNAFQFIQNIERCDFPEAVEMLAQRAGMELPQRKDEADSRQREELRASLYEVGRAAAIYYRDMLYSREGLKALEYLHNRGLTERTIKRFGLGYAPDGHDAAIRTLEAQGFSREHMKAFAVAGEKEGRWYDYFRGRVMFPIIDRRGRIIAFGGRVMDGSEPKYLNSPDTPVFNKRQNLFGLNLVQQIRNLQRIVLVEGYMDVLAMHQAGVPYAVASLGTALTEEQAKLMRRYAEEVDVAYDGDTAGQKATLRSLDILKGAGLVVKVVEIPDGMDPDDYARKFGLTGLEDLLDSASHMIDYRLRTIAAGYDLAKEDGRRRYLSQSCREVLAAIASPVELDIYVKRLSRETGVSESAIFEETGIERSQKKALEYSSKHSRYTNAVLDEPSKTQEISHMEGKRHNAVADAECFLLLLAMSDGRYAAEIRSDPGAEAFSGERKEIADTVMAAGACQEAPSRLMNQLSSSAQAELARILIMELPEENAMEKLYTDCLSILAARSNEQKMENLKEELKAPGISAAQKDKLLAEMNELIKRKRSHD